MKTVKMSVQELMEFKKIAKKDKQKFDCHIKKGGYYEVIASLEYLTFLGY